MLEGMLKGARATGLGTLIEPWPKPATLDEARIRDETERRCHLVVTGLLLALELTMRDQANLEAEPVSLVRTVQNYRNWIETSSLLDPRVMWVLKKEIQGLAEALEEWRRNHPPREEPAPRDKEEFPEFEELVEHLRTQTREQQSLLKLYLGKG